MVVNSIIISSAIMNYSVHKSHPIFEQLNLGIKTVTYAQLIAVPTCPLHVFVHFVSENAWPYFFL